LETKSIRFNVDLANRREVRPGIFDVFGYETGEVHSVPAELATKWVASGLAEDVSPSRSAEVERATSEPRSERAIGITPSKRRRGR